MKIRKVALSVFSVLALLYAAICAYMFFAQRSMQYRPDPTPVQLATSGLTNATQQALTTRDQETIIVWWIAPRDEEQPVFLYLHGNGGNLNSRAARFAKLTEGGAGVLAVSYRGYGGSSGSPTEAGLRIDARTAYDELVNVNRIQPKRIVLFGESLGTMVATLLASEVSISAMVLDSSFDSALDVASRAYPWLPVRWLLRDQFRADLVASKVIVPVQQIHCRDDPVTPLASAQQLSARFANAKPIFIVEGRCHVASFTAFERAVTEFVSPRARE